MEENKGQNNKSHVDKYKGEAPLDFFLNAPEFTFIFKKCEKVVTALYMVTGLLVDTEPLKWKLRALGAEMLGLTNNLKDKFSAERDSLVYGLKSHILEISSLLDISKYSGLMSEMNVGILNDELRELGNMYERERVIEVNSGSLVIDHSFFAPNRKLAPQAGNSFPQRNLAAFEQKHPNPAESSKGHKKNLQNAEKKSTENVIRKPAEKTEKKGHRREAILAVIRKKGEVTIKDVSLTMQEVSEKTIQRELLSLIEEGILKKEGERRWSRYSLAQPS